MATAVNFDPLHNSRLHEFANLHKAWFLSLIFTVLIGAQAIAFLILGTGRAGLGVALSILVGGSLLALACAWRAFRRAQGICALFWFLFAAVLIVLLVPTVFQTYDACLAKALCRIRPGACCIAFMALPS